MGLPRPAGRFPSPPTLSSGVFALRSGENQLPVVYWPDTTSAMGCAQRAGTHDILPLSFPFATRDQDGGRMHLVLYIHQDERASAGAKPKSRQRRSWWVTWRLRDVRRTDRCRGLLDWRSLNYKPISGIILSVRECYTLVVGAAE